MPILESDVERTCDLDKEVKASGFITAEEMGHLDKFNQELLDKDDDDKFLEDEQMAAVEAAEVEELEEDNEEEKASGSDEESEEDEEEDGAEPNSAEEAEAWAKRQAERKALKAIPRAKKESEHEDPAKAEKMAVNLDYVKHRVKQQFANKARLNKTKTNKNKDKGQAKTKELIRDRDYEME